MALIYDGGHLALCLFHHFTFSSALLHFGVPSIVLRPLSYLVGKLFLKARHEVSILSRLLLPSRSCS